VGDKMLSNNDAAVTMWTFYLGLMGCIGSIVLYIIWKRYKYMEKETKIKRLFCKPKGFMEQKFGKKFHLKRGAFLVMEWFANEYFFRAKQSINQTKILFMYSWKK